MQLRFFAVRAIRFLPCYQSHLSQSGHFIRYVSTAQTNLKPILTGISSVCHQQFRYKITKAKGQKGKKVEEESESESDSDEEIEKETDTKSDAREKLKVSDPGIKIMSFTFDSARADKVIRRALNISSKSVEDKFYAKQIQINGEVIKKKSQSVREGDIITIPLEPSSGKTAPGALIEIIDVLETENGVLIKFGRNKKTLVST